MKNIISIFLTIVCLSFSLEAQSFTASVNSTEVPVNEPFEVAFEFNGDEINSIKNFKAPDFKYFHVLSGPNHATSMQIINGAVSASLKYSFYVQASQQGSFTIGAASVDYKGKTYKTEPIKITIVQGSTQKQSAGREDKNKQNVNIADNVFIRAFADRNNVLKGEQVTVTYKLYTRMDISSPQISKLPTYQGFWSEEIETSNRITFSSEVVDGKQYRVAVLKKAALFPTQTGQLSVSPFELIIPVLVPKQRRRGDIFDEFFNDPFFSQAQTVEYKATSNVLKINVRPLPSNDVPASFNGVVGDFSLNAAIDKSSVKANEPVTLKFNISGTGNIKLIELSELNLPSGFEKYDPKISEKINRTGKISGQKTIEYLIVPRIPGQKEIPSIEFSYFNPAVNKYVVINSPSFLLNIEKGEGMIASDFSGFNKEDVKLLGEDIRFIKTSVDGLEKKGEYPVYKLWFWGITFIPLFALTGIIAWKKREEKLSGNVKLLKYHRAEKLARNKLKAAKISLEKKNQQQFYSDISQALFGYLEGKLNIEKSEISIERASEILKNRNVNDALTADVKQTIEQCEYARFAPQSNVAEAMQEMYNNAVRLIIELEKELSKTVRQLNAG